MSGGRLSLKGKCIRRNCYYNLSGSCMSLEPAAKPSSCKCAVFCIAPAAAEQAKAVMSHILYSDSHSLVYRTGRKDYGKIWR